MTSTIREVVIRITPEDSDFVATATVHSITVDGLCRGELLERRTRRIEGAKSAREILMGAVLPLAGLLRIKKNDVVGP